MLSKLHRTIDRITQAVGRVASWGIVLAIAVSAVNAVARKLFDLSSNAMLELQWYLFGAAFMWTAAWALARNEHARIEILSQGFAPRLRAWIDLLGHVFILAPFTGAMIYFGLPWLWRSAAIGETSANAGGLIVWPSKAILLAGFVLLALQAVSEIAKALLRCIAPDPQAPGP